MIETNGENSPEKLAEFINIGIVPCENRTVQVKNRAQAIESFDENEFFKWSFNKDNFNLKVWVVIPPFLNHSEVDKEGYDAGTYGTYQKNSGVKFYGNERALTEIEKGAIKIVLHNFFK